MAKIKLSNFTIILLLGIFIPNFALEICLGLPRRARLNPIGFNLSALWADFAIAKSGFIFQSNAYASDKFGVRKFEDISGVDLIYPATDHIILAGKDFLEFRWKRTGIIEIRHYEFKLYKGYETKASTLIFKQNFSYNTYPIKLPISLFEKNQVYTWSLRQVFFNGEKTRRSFSSFNIVK